MLAPQGLEAVNLKINKAVFILVLILSALIILESAVIFPKIQTGALGSEPQTTLRCLIFKSSRSDWNLPHTYSIALNAISFRFDLIV